MDTVIRIYDRAFRETGITGSPLRLSRKDEFRGAGEAELTLADTDGAAGLLMPDGYIMAGGVFYLIRSVERDLAAGTVTARCAGLLALLGGTVIPEEYTSQGQASALMYSLVRKCTANLPAGLTLADIAETETVKLTSGRSIVYDDLVSLCYLGDVGMSLEYTGDALRFSVCLPRDRTADSANPAVVSRLMGSFDSERVLWDYSGYRNVAVVSGAEKDDGTRYTQTVRSDSIAISDTFPDSEYFDRQMLVNYTSPVRPFMYENAEGLLQLDEAAYLAAMRASGAAALGRCRPRLRLYGSTDSSDILPGDRVTVMDAETGIAGTALAESVTVTQTPDGTVRETELSAVASAELG